MDLDYADVALLANTPAQVESLLQRRSRQPWSLREHQQNEYAFFREGFISTLKGGSLKLVDNFTYLGSSASSTESDANIRLTMVWDSCQ